MNVSIKSSTLRHVSEESATNLVTFSVKRSRTPLRHRSRSSYIREGAGAFFSLSIILCQVPSRKLRSALNLSSFSCSLTVLTISPHTGGFIFRIISLSLCLSISFSIRREIPTWSTVGMNTRCLPGIDMCEVTLAPLLPRGSLEI